MTASFAPSTALRGGGVYPHLDVTPILTGLNVVVPTPFLGMHLSRNTFDPSFVISTGANAGLPYPPLPAENYTYGWARSLDCAPVWRPINTANGVYDAAQVALLDTWVNYCYARGLKTIYTMYATPAWAASTVIDFTDQYGYQYGANHPSDLGSTGSVFLNTFVTWLVNRYNSGGVSKITAIEIWNEPLYSTAASSYFTGTGAQLAQMGKAVYQAAKAVDPNIIVLSPAFVGSPSRITTYLAGVVGDTTTGANWINAVAYHYYDFNVPNAVWQGDIPNTDIRDQILPIKAAMTAGGAGSLPLYDTEAGWLTTPWNGFSSAKRAQLIKMSGLVHAAMGFVAQIYYKPDGYYLADGTVNPNYTEITSCLFGGPLVDQNIAAALLWVNQLSGKTITEIGNVSGGGMYAITTTGIIRTG